MEELKGSTAWCVADPKRVKRLGDYVAKKGYGNAVYETISEFLKKTDEKSLLSAKALSEVLLDRKYYGLAKNAAGLFKDYTGESRVKAIYDASKPLVNLLQLYGVELECEVNKRLGKGETPLAESIIPAAKIGNNGKDVGAAIAALKSSDNPAGNAAERLKKKIEHMQEEQSKKA